MLEPTIKEWDGDPILSALSAALNLTSAAHGASMHMGAHRGLDVAWHAEKIREAVQVRVRELRYLKNCQRAVARPWTVTRADLARAKGALSILKAST